MSTITNAFTIPARDDYPLAATLCEPDPASPRGAATDAAVLINSATAVKQVYYRRFATFLASRGVPALTFDYRGIGQSRPPSLKRFRARMAEWGTRDIPAAIDWLADRFPQARLFIVGHSAGGQLLGLAENNRRAHGLVAVCAQSGDWRLWKGLRRYLLAGLWYGLVPALSGVLGYFPGRKLGLGEDLPGGVAREWARWCRSRGYLTPHLGRSLPDHFGGFRGPVLAYSSADDQLAPPAAVESLLCMYSRAANVERRHLEPRAQGLRAVGHFGFFRRECAGLWPDVTSWMRAAVRGVPSPTSVPLPY
jgi:predicted alpha/beta hydrolase